MTRVDVDRTQLNLAAIRAGSTDILREGSFRTSQLPDEALARLATENTSGGSAAIDASQANAHVPAVAQTS
jgi:hypothetical protein